MQKCRNLLWITLTLIGINWMFQATARGATFADVPFYFGITNGVLDESGRLLEGDATTPGALVQILDAQNGVYPPHADGTPHTNNPVLKDIRIGQGTDSAAGLTGKASGSLSIDRYQQNKIFARIFNRSTTEDASFYVDSPLYTNSTTTYGVFIVAANQTDQPIDTDDDDGDSLVNSWERSMGSDPLNSDTDNDGISDGSEFRAGTSPTDPKSNLSLVEMGPAVGGNLSVQWDSVPGKSYQLQCTYDELTAANPVYVDVNGPVQATEYTASTVVTNISATGELHFRILLLE